MGKRDMQIMKTKHAGLGSYKNNSSAVHALPVTHLLDARADVRASHLRDARMLCYVRDDQMLLRARHQAAAYRNSLSAVAVSNSPASHAARHLSTGSMGGEFARCSAASASSATSDVKHTLSLCTSSATPVYLRVCEKKYPQK